MTDLVKLRQEHAQLVEIAGRLGRAVLEPHPPSTTELYKLRRELTSTLIGHLKAEDWVLYPRLLASTDRKVADTARKFSEEMGGLAQAFTAYVEQWSATDIERNWRGYCQETRSILEALACRITRENRELYPLLEALDRAA